MSRKCSSPSTRSVKIRGTAFEPVQGGVDAHGLFFVGQQLKNVVRRGELVRFLEGDGAPLAAELFVRAFLAIWQSHDSTRQLPRNVSMCRYA